MGFLGSCKEEAEAFVVAGREFLGFVAEFLQAGDEGLRFRMVLDAVVFDLAEGLIAGVEYHGEFRPFDVDFGEGGGVIAEFFENGGDGGGVDFLTGGVCDR